MTGMGWYPPPTPPRRPRSALPVLLVVGAVVAVMAMVGALFVVGLNQYMTHDLVHADFETTAEPFHVGTKPDVEYALVNGTYSIRQRTDSQSLGLSLGEFPRVAYVAQTSADVTVPADQPAPSVVGLGCYDQGPDPIGYVLLVTPDGSSGRLGRTDQIGRGEPALGTFEAPANTAQPVTSLRLDCATDGPTSAGMHLAGYVNGVQVVTGHDDNGLEGYSGTGLIMIADTSGAEARFDNVVTIVPG